jgi:hypothetical protein
MRWKGFDAMLSQFANEVLSYGPAAVLPQNLNDKKDRLLTGVRGS